jgi:hypothetical protein
MTTQDSQTIADARSIVRLSNAYMTSKVLHAATEVGLFDLLAAGPLTAPVIRERLDLHPRLLHDVLDTLVGLELLTRSEDTYANNDRANTFLVTGAENYLGGVVLRSAHHHYAMWGRLTDALRTGEPQSQGYADRTAFSRLYGDREAGRRFFAHMDSHNGLMGDALSEHLDWDRYTSFTDVGGARGNLAVRLVQGRPNLRGAVFDLPEVEPYFTEHMAALGTSETISFAGGDFFADPLPDSDVVVLGHVLHDWPAEDRVRILANAAPAVRDGGAIVVYDQILDDERTDPYTLLNSLNVRLVREGGSEYSIGDLRAYLAKIGFEITAVHEVGGVYTERVAVAQRVTR